MQAFHDKLCATRVLDPACGTGNFLYVSLELMKRLEGEVLDALPISAARKRCAGSGAHRRSAPVPRPGTQSARRGHRRTGAVDRLSAMAFPHQGRPPDEPILRAFKNIEVKNAVLTWDGDPRRRKSSMARKPIQTPRRPEWPTAEFIVGNPPFIGASFLRARLGDAYTEALWEAH